MNDDRDQGSSQSPPIAGSNDWASPQPSSPAEGDSGATTSSTAEQAWQKGGLSEDERAHRERLARNREARIKRIQKTEMRLHEMNIERRGGQTRYVRSRNVEHVSGSADASFVMLIISIIAGLAILFVFFNTDLLDDLATGQDGEAQQEVIVAPAQPGQGY